MSNTPTDDNDGKKDNLIVFPSGKTLDPKEIGADFVVGGSGSIPTGELVDPDETKRDLKERIAYVKNQDLVKVFENGGDTAAAIDVVLREISEEVSHLKYERRKASKDGKNTAAYTVSRIAGLRSLAEMLIRRKEASISERLDLRSPRFQKVFKVWMQFFCESMEKSGVSEEIINVVFNQMKADMIGWEKRMEAE